jgi:hypothetical protein
MIRNKITAILRCSNCDQGSGHTTLSADKSVFSFQTPAWLRDRDVQLRLIESNVFKTESGATHSCLPANTFSLAIRTNINSNSYNSETNGPNQILGISSYPTGVDNGKINNGYELYLGRCSLPPVIEIERLAYDTNGLLIKSIAEDGGTYYLCPVILTFAIELEIDATMA